MTEILFAKIKDGATIPTKRLEDAGFDIYACFDEDEIVIQPNQTAMIPTGIISAFDCRFVVLLEERGSTGKNGMGRRAGVIDSGYRGEWIVALTNHNNKPLVITKHPDVADQQSYIVYPYSKAIVQGLLLPVPESESKEVDPDTILKIPSERGCGAFGSSGK